MRIIIIKSNLKLIIGMIINKNNRLNQKIKIIYKNNQIIKIYKMIFLELVNLTIKIF